MKFKPLYDMFVYCAGIFIDPETTTRKKTNNDGHTDTETVEKKLN